MRDVISRWESSNPLRRRRLSTFPPLHAHLSLTRFLPDECCRASRGSPLSAHRTHADVTGAHCRPFANGFHLYATKVSAPHVQDCPSDSPLCDHATSCSDPPRELHTQLRRSLTRYEGRHFTLGIIEPT